MIIGFQNPKSDVSAIWKDMISLGIRNLCCIDSSECMKYSRLRFEIRVQIFLLDSYLRIIVFKFGVELYTKLSYYA